MVGDITSMPARFFPVYCTNRPYFVVQASVVRPQPRLRFKLARSHGSERECGHGECRQAAHDNGEDGPAAQLARLLCDARRHLRKINCGASD